MNQPNLLSIPFAKNAGASTKNEIPDSPGPALAPQQATWEEGFPIITMQPPTIGGIPPQGGDFNGIFNALSEHTVYQNAGGMYKFSAELANAIGGYSKGAVLISDDGETIYRSRVDNNLVDPNVSGAGDDWANVADDDVLRQDLADPSKGAGLVAFESGSVEDVLLNLIPMANYSALRNYAGKGTGVRLTQQGIAGVFQRDDSDSTSTDNNGTIIVDGLSRRWKRAYYGAAMLRWWADPASSDASPGIQAALNSGAIFFDGEGATFNVKNLHGTWPLDLRNTNFRKIAGSVDQINCISWESQNPNAPVHHLSFENVHIDGNRVDERDMVALVENGGRSGFRFRGYVEHVRMKNCSSKNCGTDGVIMFAGELPGTKWPAFEDFVFEDCDFSGNRRHGLSFDTVRGLKMVRVKCQNNGNDLSGGPFAWDDGRAGSSHTDTAGQLYGNGVDGESYGAGNHSQNLLFEDCDMTGNARGGLLLLESEITATTTGYTPWSDIKIVRGNYDKGVHSFDGSAITILRNGAGVEITNPLRSFESLLIDEPYITGFNARIIVGRSSGAIKISRTQDAYRSSELVSALRYANFDIQLRAADTYFKDDYSVVRVSRYFTPSSSGLAVPTVVGMSEWTLTGQSTSRAGDGMGVSIFAITANINTGGNAAATVNINTGGFGKCVPAGVSFFNSGGVPIATGFKVSSFSNTGFSLSVYVASATTSGKIEISLAAFDF